MAFWNWDLNSGSNEKKMTAALDACSGIKKKALRYPFEGDWDMGTRDMGRSEGDMEPLRSAISGDENYHAAFHLPNQ